MAADGSVSLSYAVVGSGWTNSAMRPGIEPYVGHMTPSVNRSISATGPGDESQKHHQQKQKQKQKQKGKEKEKEKEKESQKEKEKEKEKLKEKMEKNSGAKNTNQKGEHTTIDHHWTQKSGIAQEVISPLDRAPPSPLGPCSYSCMALCEVISCGYTANSVGYYVVPEEKHVTPRYFFIFEASGTSPTTRMGVQFGSSGGSKLSAAEIGKHFISRNII